MNTVTETIAKAQLVIKATNMPFATIWKVGKSYSFNFENVQIGYSVKEYGVKRTVIAIIK
jgi:hypothetical protein